MHIICPHCTTSYAIDLATLGVAGRTVRCSRCKEVWLARPEDAVELVAAAPAMAAANESEADAAAEWDSMAREDDGAGEAPVVDSPSISGDWPAEDENKSRATDDDWAAVARDAADAEFAHPGRPSWFRKLLAPGAPAPPPPPNVRTQPPPPGSGSCPAPEPPSARGASRWSAPRSPAPRWAR